MKLPHGEFVSKLPLFTVWQAHTLEWINTYWKTNNEIREIRGKKLQKITITHDTINDTKTNLNVWKKTSI